MDDSKYYNMIFATYIASFLSGISLKNLTNKDTPSVVKTLAEFHLYYTIRRFVANPSLMQQYLSPKIISTLKSHLPISYKDFESSTKDSGGNYFDIAAAMEYSDNDYRSMIAYNFDGLTSVGTSLFQRSVKVFTRFILGAQADTRWSIIGKGAKSLPV